MILKLKVLQYAQNEFVSDKAEIVKWSYLLVRDETDKVWKLKTAKEEDFSGLEDREVEVQVSIEVDNNLNPKLRATKIIG